MYNSLKIFHTNIALPYFIFCLGQVQENRQIIIKEEGSKEEDRQEEADVKNK